MKQLSFFLIVLVALFSCTPQEMPQNPSDNPSEEIEDPNSPFVITATFPATVITKVGMTPVLDGLSAVWMEDDFLTISNGTACERYIITSISEDGKTATLQGKPLEGDTFSILLSRFEEDYLDRSYKGQKQLREDAADHLLAFDVLLEGVDVYDHVTFTQKWAEEHGGKLTQSGGLLISVEIPEGVSETAVVEHVELIAQEPLFHNTNNPDYLDNSMGFSTAFSAGADRKIEAYCLTSMAATTIPIGTELSVLMTVDGVDYVGAYTVENTIEINPSRLNNISVVADGWKPVGTKGWIKTSNWATRYVNITANNGGYAELTDNLFDMNVTTIWHSPWRADRVWYDPYYEGWTVTEKSESNPNGTTNCVRLPMECVIDMGAEYFLFALDIKRRAVDNADNKTVHKTDNGDCTSCAEIWVSTDTSNEDGITMLSLTETSVLNQITEEYSKMWAQKKWYKVGDVSWDKGSATYYNDVVARLNTSYLKTRYIKVVIPGPVDVVAPILSLSEVNVYGF